MTIAGGGLGRASTHAGWAPSIPLLGTASDRSVGHYGGVLGGALELSGQMEQLFTVNYCAWGLKSSSSSSVCPPHFVLLVWIFGEGCVNGNSVLCCSGGEWHLLSFLDIFPSFSLTQLMALYVWHLLSC